MRLSATRLNLERLAGVVVSVCRKLCRNQFFATPRFSTWRTVIERSAHDLQFRVLIVHCGLNIAMSHRFHYGGKVSGSHQISRAVVMPRTIKNKFSGDPPRCGLSERDYKSN